MDLDTIYSKLEVVDDKVDKLLIWKAEHSKEHETVGRDIEEVRTILFENPGLKSQVERLWNCKKDVTNQRTKRRNFWMWILRLLIGT